MRNSRQAACAVAACVAMTGCAVRPAVFYKDPYGVGDTRLCRTSDAAVKSGDSRYVQSVQAELDRRGITPAQCQQLERDQTGAIVVGSLLVVAAVAAARAGGSGGGGTPSNSYVSDYEWDWDQFRNQYGQFVWACRGVQSGQFADNSKCFGKFQVDSRWPGP
jgi:hypothetical protein